MVDANNYDKSVIWVGCRALAAYPCDEPQNTLGPTPMLSPTMASLYLSNTFASDVYCI